MERADVERWKSKYLESLENLERLEAGGKTAWIWCVVASCAAVWPPKATTRR